MYIIVAATESIKGELLSTGLKNGVTIEWVSSSEAFANHPDADAYIDLLFSETSLLPISSADKPVFVSSVVKTLKDLPDSVIRINGWPTFLNRSSLEAAANNDTVKQKATEVISCFNKEIIWAPDSVGLISARVVGCIINEAYLALDEEISSKEDIDTAMKLGTNYPYGPFEWAEKIGISNILTLLEAMHQLNPGYIIAESLINEVKK